MKAGGQSQGGLRAACGSKSNGLGLGATLGATSLAGRASSGKSGRWANATEGRGFGTLVEAVAVHLQKSLARVLSLPEAAWARAGRPKAFHFCCKADTKNYLPWQGRKEAPRAALQCKALEGLEWTPFQAARLKTHPWEGRLLGSQSAVSMAVKAAWFSSVMLETMPIRSRTEEGTWSGMPQASGAEQERGVLHTAEMATNTRQW